MPDAELYPELVDYIFENYPQFLTTGERWGARAINKKANTVEKRMLELMENNVLLNGDENFKKLSQEGIESFKTGVASRIFQQYKDKLHLNLCPQCGKIARTPQAKQCRFCYNDWHTQ